jgi:hypothetical protein
MPQNKSVHWRTFANKYWYQVNFPVSVMKLIGCILFVKGQLLAVFISPYHFRAAP